MPNEPVQVVTNPQRLRTPREKGGGGAGEDFFEGDDKGFGEHRDFLAASLRGVIDTVRSEAWQRMNGDAAHLKVTMRPRAIAKSHRPQRAVFTSKVAPHVATARIGEPIYAVTSSALEGILAHVSSAPTEVPTRVDKDTGELRPNPSRLRCELSAVDRIELWTGADKRSFSAANGAEWLSQSGTGGQTSSTSSRSPGSAPTRSWRLRNKWPPGPYTRAFHSSLSMLARAPLSGADLVA